MTKVFSQTLRHALIALAASLLVITAVQAQSTKCSLDEYRVVVMDWSVLASKPDMDQPHRIIKDECVEGKNPTKVTVVGVNKTFTSVESAQEYVTFWKTLLEKRIVTPQEVTDMKMYFEETRKKVAAKAAAAPASK